MNKGIEFAVVAIVQVGMYFGLPLVTIWGWARWARRSHSRSASAILSLIGFTLATTSLVLAIASVAYAHRIGGFPYYDPLLLRIYGTGTLLSILALLFSLGGVWRPNLLRWHATICSTCTLLFWFASAMGE
ncbi:MAG TPA: hypothetical protein VE377_09560 [Candidatus Dormibacteraeota bacterium]|nr:hypothetical protein [Candidatus Dormibacteraeota bacterium]